MDNGASSYRRFLNGDDNGLAEIIRQYNTGLTLYINSFVGNISVADELSEEVFVKIGVKRPRFSEKSTFKTWLYAIGRNVASDHLRKASKTESVPLDACFSLAGEQFPETDVLKNEENTQLYQAMQKLKSDYRQVLWLSYFEDFSNKEIASVMKKSAHSIETLTYRARNALREELRKEGFVYENI